ncbi:MAG: hypothetical protein Q7R76_05580 [Candidatus Woesearchaeota archaeon]|nr:hypothetical protein [Candidatus Woesearchaeota archaeon]
MTEPIILLPRLVATVNRVVQGTWSPSNDDQAALKTPQRSVQFHEANNDFHVYSTVQVHDVPGDGAYVDHIRLESTTRAADRRLDAVWYRIVEKMVGEVQEEHGVKLIALDTGVFAYHPLETDFAHDGRLEAVVRTVYNTGRTLRRMIDTEAQRIFDRHYLR